jgi:hypothetical protein
MSLMNITPRWAQLRQNVAVRIGLLVLGVLLLLITPVLGVLPGPGGIFTFAIGLGLVLQNSLWARRRYVRFKRAQPRMGHWADLGLRRPSARRRAARRKGQ